MNIPGHWPKFFLDTLYLLNIYFCIFLTDVKNPKERLNKFEPDFIDDDEDLDLSV